MAVMTTLRAQGVTPPPGGKLGQAALSAAVAPADRGHAVAVLVAVVLHGLAMAAVVRGRPVVQVEAPVTPARVMARLIVASAPSSQVVPPPPQPAIERPQRPPTPLAELAPPVAKPHRSVRSKPRLAPPRKAAAELAAPVEVAVPEVAVPPAPAGPPTAPTVAKVDLPPVESAPRLDAAYLNNPAPAYPPAARRQGQQGQVMLRVQVEPSGHPARVEVARSSGHRALDRAARAAVERWQFVPARRGEAPVVAWVLVPVRFALNP